MITTVTSKGQITVPQSIRDKMELKEGDVVTLSLKDGDTLLMKKFEQEIDQDQEVAINLLRLLLQENKKILISGGSSFAKTVLMKRLAHCPLYRSVWVTGSLDDYDDLATEKEVTIMENKADFIHHLGKPIDLWLMDETAQYLEKFNRDRITAMNIPILATTQLSLQSLQKKLPLMPFSPDTIVMMESGKIRAIYSWLNVVEKKELVALYIY